MREWGNGAALLPNPAVGIFVLWGWGNGAALLPNPAAGILLCGNGEMVQRCCRILPRVFLCLRHIHKEVG